MAVGEVHAPKRLTINNPKIIFLLIMVIMILIHLMMQLKVELKQLLFITKLN